MATSPSVICVPTASPARRIDSPFSSTSKVKDARFGDTPADHYLYAGAITGVTGATTWLGSPPLSCTPGSLLGPNAFVWDEQQNVPLSLAVDMVNNPGSSTSPVPGAISGNYDSHFLHFEDFTGVSITGTVTYATPIVAVIFRTLNLDNSDVPAGAPGTIYPTGYAFRGLGPGSWVSINSNALTFNLNTIAPNQFENQVRVITQATPAPGSLALLGLGAVVCRRRRRKAVQVA